MSIRRGSIAERRSVAVAGGGRGPAGVLALGLAGCAAGPRPGAAAPVSAQVIFGRTNPQAVSAMIADKCRAMGWAVDGGSAGSVTCTASVTPGRRIMNTLLMQNERRQTQLVSHHFILTGVGGDEVRVQAESWLSDPDRGRRRALGAAKAAKVDREMAGFLVLMGGRLARATDATAAEP